MIADSDSDSEEEQDDKSKQIVEAPATPEAVPTAEKDK
jgi:hypothetical protein